jgi:hypothetical protein
MIFSSPSTRFARIGMPVVWIFRINFMMLMKTSVSKCEPSPNDDDE